VAPQPKLPANDYDGPLQAELPLLDPIENAVLSHATRKPGGNRKHAEKARKAVRAETSEPWHGQEEPDLRD
jgi:hypothetical protein